MTRINSGLSPSVLTDEHLLAEHREIKRICNLYLVRRIKQINGGKVTPIPKEFSLGKGHVLFFIDKQNFTSHRYKCIHLECKLRGFNVTNYINSWEVYGQSITSAKGKPEYVPAKAHIQLVVSRIIDNIKTGNLDTYHYYGNKETKTEAIDRLQDYMNAYPENF